MNFLRNNSVVIGLIALVLIVGILFATQKGNSEEGGPDLNETPNGIPVKLYYYNSELDLDEKGNVECKSVVAVNRTIPQTSRVLFETIELLLQGNLTEEERESGISTEYPLSGFSLKNAKIEDGTAVLEFDDPQFKTSGGACRASILFAQIEATAKQFPSVNQVKFLPEDIFQP